MTHTQIVRVLQLNKVRYANFMTQTQIVLIKQCAKNTVLLVCVS